MPPSSTLLTTSRVLAYSLTSTLAAATVVYNAFRERPNFYSAMVALGRSNGNVGILLNFGLLVTFMTGKFMQLMFFGNLRRVEIEHLWERTWYSVTDSLFAMTIFRDQFDAGFVILFVALLFVKVFHWLAGDRVELMEQTPSLPRFFHFRMASILSSLFLVDFISILFFIDFLITEKDRSGLIIMFASEFMILFCTLNNTLAKYLINCYDSRREEPWEQKSMWVSTADLVTDFFKLLTYLTFFSLIFSYYGLPLNIVRDVWMTGRSFYGRIRDLVREEMAIHGASTTSNASAQPSLRADSQAAQPQVQPSSRPTASSASGLNETPKKLPCGHIFHFYCLRSWLERQQSCPTCRRTVLDANGQPVNQPPTAAPGAVPARPVAAPATGAARRGASAPAPETGAATPAATAAQRIGQFARQLESQAQRQRELELEGRAGASSSRSSGAASSNPPASAPTAGRASGSIPNPAASMVPAAATPPDNAAAVSSLSRTDQRPTSTSSANPSALINAVFADPTTPGTASQATSAARYPSATAASIAGGSSRPGAHWGSAYGAHSGSNLGNILPPAPPGYGYHQRYPNKKSQIQHSLPLPNGGLGTSSWTPPEPSSLASPQTQATSISAQASSSAGASSSTPPTSSTAAAPSSEGASSAASPPVPSPSVEEATTEEPAGPREAARAAALKRFADSSGLAAKSVNRLASVTKSQQAASTPEPTVPVVAAEKVEVLNAPPHSFSAPGNRQLIPLFDTTTVPDYQTLHQTRLPYPLASTSQTNPLAPTNEFNPSFHSSRFQSLAASSGVSTGNELTTKETLENSLRALVAVQENVWKAIEEVTRVVSSLPSDAPTNVGASPVGRAESLADSERRSPKSIPFNLKGKQAAEGVNAPSAGSSSSASPPPPSARSISPTITPPTKTQNLWANESALSSGNSTPAVEHSQSALFSNPSPRSHSPPRQTYSSTSGIVVDELDMTDEQRNQEVNNMLANHKPKRRVSFASRDDTIEPSEEKETSEESQQEEVETPLVNGHMNAEEAPESTVSSASDVDRVNGTDESSDVGTGARAMVNGTGTYEETEFEAAEAVEQAETLEQAVPPSVNGSLLERDAIAHDDDGEA